MVEQVRRRGRRGAEEVGSWGRWNVKGRWGRQGRCGAEEVGSWGRWDVKGRWGRQGRWGSRR